MKAHRHRARAASPAPAFGYPLMAALLAGLFPVAAAQAQATPPNAGETLRELREPPRLPPRTAPALTVPADADTAADTSQRFFVGAVRLEGNASIPAAQLQPLVDGLAGREVTLEELRQASRRITSYYRERGFVVARAYVPAQSIESGSVRIAIVEGTIASSTVVNTSVLQQGTLDATVAAQRLEGRTIHSDDTDRALLLLADLPAMGKVNGLLKPGREVGTSDLVITAEPGRRYDADVTLDNYGNRYTGENRLSAHLDVNSPLRLGDRLSVRTIASDRKLLYGRLAFDLPAGSDGARLGAAVSSSSYQLGREFAYLDAGGTANTAGIYGSYPALRGLNANVWLGASLDFRKLSDEIRATAITTRKSSQSATVEAYGDWADSLGGGAYSTWRVTGAMGQLRFEDAAALAADQAGPATSGSYAKLQLSLNRLQSIMPRVSVLAALSGQAANKNLDSSEKFVLGGVYGVRAYPAGEGGGDAGWLANIDLRYDLGSQWQASVFYDAGAVRTNLHPYTSAYNRKGLRGHGVGISTGWGGIIGKAMLAWRDAQDSVTAPDRSPRLWVSMMARF